MPSLNWAFLLFIYTIAWLSASQAKIFRDILTRHEKEVVELTGRRLSLGGMVRQRRGADNDNNNKKKPALNLTSSELPDENHNQAIIHWSGDNSDTIFVLTRQVLPNSTVLDSRLWRSTDYGSKFTGVTLEKNAVIRFFQTSPVNKNKMVFTDVENKKIYWTDNEGETLHAVQVDFEPDLIQFHPTQEDVLYGYSFAERLLKVTENLGRKWTLVRRYVNPRLFWGDTNQADSPSSIHMEVQDPFTGTYKYLKCEKPYQDSNCRDKTADSGVPHIDMDSLLVYKEYIFVQHSSPFSTHLYVSYKRGPFKQAYFPADRHPQDFNIVNADEGQVFIAASHVGNSVSLYLSDPTGRFYVLSLQRVVALRLRSDLFDADLYEVKGLKGTYIVNQRTDNNIRTLITYNQGGEWNAIPAPATNSSGAATNCQLPSCSLHLHLKYSYSYRRSPILSEANAPGIIMAQGVIGQGLDLLSSKFYLSTNGGLTWTEEFDGDYTHTILDQGGAMVLIDPETKVLKYSVTMGTQWDSLKLPVSNIRIVGVLSEPGITTLILNIFGQVEKSSKKTGWVIIKVNMSSILSTPCEDTKDYEIWRPTDEMAHHDCLLGQVIEFKRRKAQSQCFNGKNFNANPNISSCPLCLREDYECDFGFELDGKKCKVATWFDPNMPVDDCPEGGTFFKSKGYRKVASDLCTKDQDIQKQFGKIETPCPVTSPGKLQLYAQTSNMVATGKQIVLYLQQEGGSKLNTNYTWMFGKDGPTESSIGYSNNSNKTHTFQDAGVHKVMVTAKNSNGSASTILDILVRATIKTVYLDTPRGGQAKKPVQFEVFPESSRYNEDKADLGNVYYIWHFGDESEETSQGFATWSTTVSHIYKKAGNYTVRVEASNTVSNHFQTYHLVLYGTLCTVQLNFSRNADDIYQNSIAWRTYFADIVKEVLMQALGVVRERLEVIVLRGRPTQADFSILPQQQLAAQDDSIEKLVTKLESLVQQGKLTINSTVYHLPLDSPVTVTKAVTVSDSDSQGDSGRDKGSYTAVYICVPIVFLAVFVSVLVILYYRRKFSNIRRYQLLRSHAQSADRLLDDTDDDDPLLEPNPDLNVDRRLAMNDDNADDPLAARFMTTRDGNSSATVNC